MASIGAIAFCIGGVAFYKVNHVERDAEDIAVSTAGWEQANARYVTWGIRELFGRTPGRRWTVEYEYTVKGVLYRGCNINPHSTSVAVGFSEFPIDTMARLNEIKTVWYDPHAPNSSAVFNCGTDDIKTAIRRAYIEQVIVDKENGRWP